LAKKVLLFFIIFISFVVPAYAEIVNGIAVKVGKGIITINEFNKAFKQMERDALLIGKKAPTKKDVMDQLVDDLIINNEAEKKGMVVSDGEIDQIIEDIKKQNNLSDIDFTRELKKEGMTLEDLKEKYRMGLMKTRFINQLASESIKSISEDEIKSFYEDPKNNKLFTLPDMVELYEIYIKINQDADYQEAMVIKDKAKQIWEKAKSGEDFNNLIKEYSMAQNKDKEKPGYLGSFTREQLYSFMKPEDVNFIFSLDKNEITSPIRLADGYYIFKIEEKREKRILDFKDAYENIKRYLIKKKGEEIFRKWIIEKKNMTSIQIMIEME